MSTATKLAAILSSKAAIKSAIEEKGVTVGNAPLSDYATKIGQISGSSSNDEDMTDLNKVYYIDHTGHVHYSYTLQEFLALQSEPTNPSFTGLTPTGWQMSLTAAKAFVTANGYGPIIGQTYTTNDGTTRVYVNIDEDFLKTFRVYYSGLSNANKTKLKIDWGDGSAQEQSNANAGSFVHTYAQQGQYVIKYIPEDNTVAYLPANSSSYSSIFGYYYENPGYSLLNLITKIEFGGNISGFLGSLVSKRCESVSLPYGCSLSIGKGAAPTYIFSTGSGVTSLNQRGDSQIRSNLKTVILPEGVTTPSAFSQAFNLDRVVMPSTLTTFPVFSYDTKLQAANIPANITSLQNNTFTNCVSLKKVKMSSGILTFGTSVFQRCSSLEEIVFSNTITTFGNYTCESCFSLKTVTLPTNLTTFGQYNFQNCYSLTGPITIPSNVTEIPLSCFNSCYSLVKVTIPNTVTIIKASAFQNCFSLTEINIPTSLTTLEKSAFNSCFKLSGTITIPSGITTITNSCFANCASITKVSLPNTITTIEASAFQYCYSLKEINIPTSLTSIGQNAFQYCVSLSGNINIPEGVTTIGASAFAFAIYRVEEITIPSTVTSIGNYAFAAQQKYLPETVPNKIVHVKATTPPTLGTGVFSTEANLEGKLTIYVPANKVDTYKTATNWKNWKNIIFAEPTV